VKHVAAPDGSVAESNAEASAARVGTRVTRDSLREHRRVRAGLPMARPKETQAVRVPDRGAGAEGAVVEAGTTWGRIRSRE
jgi:hypothetical protein